MNAHVLTQRFILAELAVEVVALVRILADVQWGAVPQPQALVWLESVAGRLRRDIWNNGCIRSFICIVEWCVFQCRI